MYEVCTNRRRKSVNQQQPIYIYPGMYIRASRSANATAYRHGGVATQQHHLAPLFLFLSLSLNYTNTHTCVKLKATRTPLSSTSSANINTSQPQAVFRCSLTVKKGRKTAQNFSRMGVLPFFLAASEMSLPMLAPACCSYRTFGWLVEGRREKKVPRYHYTFSVICEQLDSLECSISSGIWYYGDHEGCFGRGEKTLPAQKILTRASRTETEIGKR